MSNVFLKYRADRRTLLFVALYYFSAYGSFYLYTNELLNGLATAVLCILSSFLCFSVSVIIHNTVHAPIFHNKTHNKIMQFVLSIAYGYSVSAFVPGHNFSHHKELETPKDIMRSSKARFKWHLLNQLFFFFIVTSGAAKYEMKWAAKMYHEKRDWFDQWLMETLIVFVIKVALIFVHWQAALIFVWIPHFYALWALLGVNLWQHDGCDAKHAYNHSRTFTGWFMNFWCFNNGYHGAHHDRPSLHWSLLPAYHAKNISPHIHPNLEVSNMPLYFWKTYIYPGKRMNYDGSPFILEPKVEDEDWTADINVSSTKHKYDFGAEAMSFDEMLGVSGLESDKTQLEPMG